MIEIQQQRIAILRGFLDAVLKDPLQPLTREAATRLKQAIGAEYPGITKICKGDGP